MTYDLSFKPLTYDQYTAIIDAGTMSGHTSPMRDQPDYDALIRVFGAANIDPRVPLAITWQEGHQGSDPGLVAAPFHNLGGVKFVNQPGAFDTHIAADTGGTYAGFADLSVYWSEVVRILNNSIIGPSFRAGDLNGAMDHWTNGPGTGAPKVAIYDALVRDYPPSGDVTGVYGEDIVNAMAAHLGEASSDGTLDPWNAPHLWEGWCEASTEGAQYAAGLHDVVHRGSAALKLDAVTAQGFLQTAWPPEHGAICLWGRTFDPSGHTCLWDDDKQMFLSTLYGPSRIGYYYSDAWKNAMAGWYRAPGAVAPHRTQPIPTPPTPLTPFFVDGNPYGPIPVRDLFWARWDALNTMGKKMDHPGQVNGDGLAMPTLGYPMQAEKTLATGRRVQRFERGWLATQGNAAPFDVVVLMLGEQPPP